MAAAAILEKFRMAISPQRLTIYLYSAHRAVIFAIAQLSCLIDRLITARNGATDGKHYRRHAEASHFCSCHLELSPTTPSITFHQS